MFGWCGYGSSEDNREFNVVIYKDDYKELCACVLRKPHIETGGDLFGLWANKYTAVIQLVLGPGKRCRRTSTSFYQDVNYLEKVGTHLTQKEGICHIGEWHSHHQLGLARPSGGDENTVWSNMPTYNLTRFVIFIANIDHSKQSYSVNVGCFLFEINSDGKQLPVLQGKFKILNQESPFFGKSEVNKYKEDGEEDKKGDEFNVDIKDLTSTAEQFSIYVPVKQKKRVGQGNEHAQNSEPKKKKNRTDPPTTPPTTAQNQAGKQKHTEASRVTGENILGDPKTNEEEVEKQKQQEERNEPPEQGDSETSNKEDRKNNQNGPNKTNEKEEALPENKENSVMQGGNMKEQENVQASEIELKENRVQQSQINQGNCLGIKAVDQGSDETQNQCEQDSKNHELEHEGGGSQIEAKTPGTSVDHDRSTKNLASNTEPGNKSPAMPQHNPGENEGSKTSGYADMESKQGDTKANENKGKVQKEDDEEMKENERVEIRVLGIQDQVNQSHERQQNPRKSLDTKEDSIKLTSPVMKGENAPTTSQGQLDEKEVSRPDIEEGKEAHSKTNGKEGAAKNSGLREEQSEGVQKKGNPAAHSQELHGNLGTKTKKDHDNGETQSSEREKQESKTEVKKGSNYGGKQSSESLDNKGKLTLENTKESTEKEKSLGTKKGPTSGQEKKGEKKQNPKPSKNPGTKGKPKQGATPAPAASSGKSNYKPPNNTASAKPNQKKPAVAKKAK